MLNVNPAQFKLWVGLVPTLTAEQTSELLTRFKLLSKTNDKPHVGKQQFGERVLQALCTVLRKNNVETPSVTTLRKSAAYVNSREKLQDLQTFFEKISQSKMVQDAILKEAIQLLYYDLVQWKGVSISSHTMLKQIHRIPATLNKSFPGYAASGMLTKIVKAKE